MPYLTLSVYFSAALSRSKSTPGLVESAGKITLQSMVLHRNYTLPPNMVSKASSRESPCSSRSSRGSSRGTNSSNNAARSINSHSQNSHQSDDVIGPPPGGTDPSGGDITNSMTVSSITSYITDSGSAQKSPLATEAPQSVSASPHHRDTPPMSSGSSGRLPPIPTSYSPFTVPDSSSSAAAPQPGQSIPMVPMYPLQPPPAATGGVSPQSFNGQQTPFQSMFAGHAHTFPPGSTSTLPTNSVSAAASGTHPSSHSPYRGASTGNLVPLGSNGSLQRDPSNEILLAEISRLRERLQMLETENTHMSLKLNQQQHEVEHRLAEIEMHFCGSDSIASGSDDHPPEGNKESII